MAVYVCYKSLTFELDWARACLCRDWRAHIYIIVSLCPSECRTQWWRRQLAGTTSAAAAMSDICGDPTDNAPCALRSLVSRAPLLARGDRSLRDVHWVCRCITGAPRL